ncbi:hypothetical protein [Streptomyces sp. NPDC005799]|uniref:hypothetical protein n=1 Tax=Streptomyces sp. NPDC005799 TaxID=3154678 RepID=UPI0033FEA7C2
MQAGPHALAERSRVMADTWAHVATALAAPAIADGQPVTYDVNVAVDPKAAAEAFERHLLDAHRKGGTSRT